MKKLLFLLSAALLFLLASCNQQDEGFVLDNINGYTMQDDKLIEFQSMAIRNGKIAGIGSSEEIMDQFNHLETIDGDGQTVLPGLIDAHAHVMGLGFRELDINVSGITSLNETLETISKYAEENPELEWIRGRGWNQVLWDVNEFPTAADLDKVVDDRPVYLTRIDGHASWANSKAIELAGISRDTPDPQGGRILRNSQGDATGIFVDAAMNYFSDAIPERTSEEHSQAFSLALENMAEHGITSVHDARTAANTWELYKEFAHNGKLLTRIYAMINGTGSEFDEFAKQGPINSYSNDLLALRSVKISADGALGSRGAAMIEHYHDDPDNKGLLFYDQEELNNMVLKGASEGYQINIHAIGDAANRQVLNSFEYAANELGSQSELRHRVEHAQIVHPDDIPRFVELDLIASMQQTHATSDMNMAEDRVGPERIKTAYAWQTFLDQGTIIAGGSDFPVEEVNPFFGLYSGVTRKDHEGMPPGGWYSEQAMSRIEVLKSFTIDAAYAAHQEDVIGSLEPGKWADFIIIDRDYMTVPASEIWQINVLETWLAGKKVFEYKTTE